jgi:hypothetical protein
VQKSRSILTAAPATAATRAASTAPSRSRAGSFGGMVFTVVAATVALSSCGGGAAGGTGGGPGEPSGTAAGAASPESEVEAAFRGYYDAILVRDFETACGFNAPETNDQIVSTMEALGTTVSSCPEALEKTVEDSATAEALDTIAETAEVQEVTVTGETATLRWSADTEDGQSTTTTPLRRIDGQWSLVYTGP